MTKQKRSPWFSAEKDPPVNGDDNDVYEVRCPNFPDGNPPIERWSKRRLRGVQIDPDAPSNIIGGPRND